MSFFTQGTLYPRVYFLQICFFTNEFFLQSVFFPRPFTGSFLHLNFRFFFFTPGMVFFFLQMSFFTRGTLYPKVYFLLIYFFTNEFFFTEHTSPPVFFTGRLFLHLNFLHNIRPTSPALDPLTSGLSSLGISVPDMSTTYMTSTNKFFT
jgi:hypothetical protein